MAEIYLRHPTHGTKVATVDAEAAYDEKNGWTRYTPGENAVYAEGEVSGNELRRRGRRPLTPEE